MYVKFTCIKHSLTCVSIKFKSFTLRYINLSFCQYENRFSLQNISRKISLQNLIWGPPRAYSIYSTVTILFVFLIYFDKFSLSLYVIRYYGMCVAWVQIIIYGDYFVTSICNQFHVIWDPFSHVSRLNEMKRKESAISNVYERKLFLNIFCFFYI